MTCNYIGYVLGPAFVFLGVGSVVRIWLTKRKEWARGHVAL